MNTRTRLESMRSTISRLRPWLSYTLLIGAMLSSAGCSLGMWGLDGPMTWLRPAGDNSAIQEHVFMVSVYVCAFAFLFTGALYLIAVFRFRARPGQEDEIPEQSHGNTAIEIGLLVAFVVLLTIIAVPNVKAIFALDDVPAREEADLVVQARGYQWWWGFEYPDLKIRTANELVIPVGKKVRVELYTDNVIHSFWVPRLAGKLDVMPNQANRMWLNAKEVGVYRGQCAELCGASHAQMRFLTRVLSQADFDAWVQHEQQPAQPFKHSFNRELVERGEKVFMSSACIGCHRIAGTPAAGLTAPDLTHVGSRPEIGAGMFDNTPDNIYKWIKNPGIKPGNLMPKIPLPDEDIKAVAAYLTSLK
ncbi:MAG: cytochrome c oxidase subunit II [Candidatus Dadabacteria bacterium]|nr:MAG: cytochrome c oxidase subunit II [Candidatus Dadabacteria bacterium]